MSAGIHKLDFASSEDVRTSDKTKVETITVGNTKVARLTAQPGWVWKECIALLLVLTAAKLPTWEWYNQARYWFSMKMEVKKQLQLVMCTNVNQVINTGSWR